MVRRERGRSLAGLPFSAFPPSGYQQTASTNGLIETGEHVALKLSSACVSQTEVSGYPEIRHAAEKHYRYSSRQNGSLLGAITQRTSIVANRPLLIEKA